MEEKEQADFEYLHCQVYMLPEASGSGGLRLYRAEEFPMVWKLDRLLLDKPLIDASLMEVGAVPPLTCLCFSSMLKGLVSHISADDPRGDPTSLLRTICV